MSLQSKYVCRRFSIAQRQKGVFVGEYDNEPDSYCQFPVFRPYDTATQALLQAAVTSFLRLHCRPEQVLSISFGAMESEADKPKQPAEVFVYYWLPSPT